MDRKRVNEADFSRFLKREYPADRDWKGFFKLWLDAKGFDYGHNDEYIVDGSGDGGIDAIAYPAPGHTELPVVVIQSKYFKKAVPDVTLKKFFQAVAAFRSDSRNSFDLWLETVRNGQLRTKYNELWRRKDNLDFVLVTSGRLSRDVLKRARKLKVKVEDRKKIRALFLDMARGKTPRPERITLRMRGKILPILKNENHGLYVFSALVSDFARAYQLHPKSLFAGNVRYALRNATSKNVKEGIRNTLKNRPTEFAYFHNGITVVCKRIIVERGKVHLISPSVVNGAQTVSFVGDMAGKISPQALVLVKAIEVRAEGGFEEFETDVAMSSNTQNKVSLSDLSVIDPDLVSLERYFRARNCFLIRKKGDTPNGNVIAKIDKDRLLQLFASLDPRCGPASTKDKQDLYRSHSGRLFTDYASSIGNKKDALFLAKLDRFISTSLRKFKLSGKQGTRKKRRLSLSYFTIFTVIAELIKTHGMWNRMRTGFAEDGIWNNEFAYYLDRDVRKVATAVLALARRDTERNDTAFFKSREKVGDAISLLRKRFRNKVAFVKV